MTGGLRSGQVAEAAGVSVQTLRYYERRGLLEAPDRTLGGHRVYGADTVTLLRVIKPAQRMGFTLAEVVDLLETAAGRRRSRGARDLAGRIRVKIDELDRQIEHSCLDAACADAVACAGDDDCPVPFA